MYTWIEERDSYTIVDDCGQYMCDTDTEWKATMIMTILNDSIEDFESRGYDINDVITGGRNELI